jgi:hypothetical protein
MQRTAPEAFCAPLMPNALARQNQMTSDKDVLVYSGQFTEATFLKSLLESSGIAAWLINLGPSGDDDIGVYIARAEIARAAPLINEFKNQGTKTPKFWK